MCRRHQARALRHAHSPPRLPPNPGRWQFPQLAAVAAVLLGSAGRICANPNFQRLYRPLRCWTAAGACELAPAAALAPGAECTPTACPLCMHCQVSLVLGGLVAVGASLYAAELHQRAAFLAARPPRPAAAYDEPGSALAAGMAPCLADFFLSFALPATCALFSFVAIGQM